MTPRKHCLLDTTVRHMWTHTNYERMHKTHTNSSQTKMPAWRKRIRYKVPLLNKKLCTWYLLREGKPVPPNGAALSRSHSKSGLKLRSSWSTQNRHHLFCEISFLIVGQFLSFGFVLFCCFLAKREKGREKEREERMRTRICVSMEVWKIWETWGSRKNMINILYGF